MPEDAAWNDLKRIVVTLDENHYGKLVFDRTTIFMQGQFSFALEVTDTNGMI